MPHSRHDPPLKHTVPSVISSYLDLWCSPRPLKHCCDGEEARVGNTEVKSEPINPVKFQLNFDWPTFFILYISSRLSPTYSQLSIFFIVIIMTKNCPSAFMNAGERTLVCWYTKSICQSAKWLWVTPIDRARRPNWLLDHYVAKEMVRSYIR